jgi:ATP-binding cassette, subfamily B, bacterial
MRPLAQQIQAEYATAIAILEENLGMLPAIKTFTREREESLRYRRQVYHILKLTSQLLRFDAAMGPSVQFLALFWNRRSHMACEHADGRRPPDNPQLVSFLLYGGLLTRPHRDSRTSLGGPRRPGDRWPGSRKP